MLFGPRGQAWKEWWCVARWFIHGDEKGGGNAYYTIEAFVSRMVGFANISSSCSHDRFLDTAFSADYSCNPLFCWCLLILSLNYTYASSFSASSAFVCCQRTSSTQRTDRMRIPIENDLQIWTLVLSSISITISTVAVILRLMAKYMRNKIDFSDYCITAGLVLALFHLSVLIVLQNESIFYSTTLVERRADSQSSSQT